jgi:hypothetical protein
VSWRGLIDVRGAEPRIDWPRLAIVLVVGEVITGVLIWFLTESLGTMAMILIVLPIFALLIALDIKLRRRGPDNP